MKAILLVDIFAIIQIAQGKNDPRLKAQVWLGRNNCVHPVGGKPKITVCFDVAQKIHAEIVQPKVGDRNTCFTSSNSMTSS